MPSLPSANQYEPGTLIQGKYRLERKLGEGGMGSVWAAHHLALDTAVAIKLIRSDTNRQELAPRLMQEARAAAKLGHPAIVRVFDVGQTDDGDPFIVMELLEGESLNERLERDHRLSAVEAARLLLPIADALRAAHAKGIVHRDIKPDNVFLTNDEVGVQPKLVDFGIAKLAAREFDSQLTQRGTILGSPDYMAPEQARGEDDIDFRADIWAFSVLLYETVSGQPPFDGANYNALLHAILETAPTPLTTMCAGDAEFAELVERGLAKDRAARWQTMQELGEALARWLLKQGIFEDAAGGAIETKWILRRSDSGQRQSRPSLGSIHGYAATMPGVEAGEVALVSRRRSAEAPTSLGPVVGGTNTRARRLLGVPLALGVVAGLIFSARLLWPSAEARREKPAAPATEAAASLPPAAAPHANATANAPPAIVATPLEPPLLRAAQPAVTVSPEPLALFTGSPSPAKSASTHARTQRPPAASASAVSSAKSPSDELTPPKPAHDLLTPY